MDSQEAYEIMKQGRYVTHPILSEAGIDPLFLENGIVYGKHHEPIQSEWKAQITAWPCGTRFSSRREFGYGRPGDS